MKKLYSLFPLLLWAALSHAQRFDVSELMDFASLPIEKFDAFVAKKSYKRDYQSPKETQAEYNYIYLKKKKRSDESTVFKLSYRDSNDIRMIGYQTSSLDEFNRIRQELHKEHWTCFDTTTDVSKPVMFQKKEWTVKTSVEIKDSTPFYSLLLSRDPFPKINDVVYAEDLLKFKSHEALVSFFGQRNVLRDDFHYTEKEVNKCSVLFPNSSREVVFIWDDEANYRNISFLIIGGDMLTKNTSDYRRGFYQSEWQSKQGVTVGMRLKELQDLNGTNINFYGYGTEQGGMLAPGNSGKIDFTKLGLVLSCMDCNQDKVYQASLVNSEKAVSDERKIYVSTMVILADKNKK